MVLSAVCDSCVWLTAVATAVLDALSLSFPQSHAVLTYLRLRYCTHAYKTTNAITTRQPRHRVRSGEFDLSGKHVRLGWGSTTSTSTSTSTTATITSDSSRAHSLAATRAPLPHLRMDKPGSRVYELVPLDAATVAARHTGSASTSRSGAVVSSSTAAAAMAGPVVEEAWQNQRFDNIKRRWRGTSAASGDRPEWSTKVLDVQRLTNVFLTAVATMVCF